MYPLGPFRVVCCGYDISSQLGGTIYQRWVGVLFAEETQTELLTVL